MMKADNHVFPRRILGLLAACSLIVSASPATATSIDWRNHFCHLSNIAADHFLYDCGGYSDVIVKGFMANAVSSFYGLQIIDVTDPLAPENLGYVSIMEAKRLAVLDHYAYVSTRVGSLVAIVDIDDQQAPTVAGNIVTNANVRDLIVVNRYLYLALADESLVVYDADYPVDPEAVGAVTPPLGEVKELAWSGSHLLAAGDGGLVAYDVTTPEAPVLSGALTLPGSYTLSLTVRGDRALIGRAIQTEIIDVSEPTEMTVLGTIPEQGAGAHLSGDQAWLGVDICWDAPGLAIYDIADPANPARLHEVGRGMMGWLEVAVESHGVVVVAETMCWCAGEWPSLHIFRPGEAPPPAPLSSAKQPAVSCLLARDYVLYAGSNDLIAVRDISDPSEPVDVATFAPGRRTYALVTEGQKLLALEDWSGSRKLQIYDVGAGWEPTPRGSLVMTGEPLVVAAADQYCLIGDRAGGGLQIVDLADPDAPFVAATHFAGSDVVAVAVSENLSVANVDGDLLFLDLTDPLAPVELGSIPDAWPDFRDALQLLRLGDEVFLVCANNRPNDPYEHRDAAEIWDITDPTAPERIVYLRLLQDDFCNDLEWRDGVLYIQGRNYLTLYAWDGPSRQEEFLGRVRCGFTGYAAKLMSLAARAVASANPNGQIFLWPLQQEDITAAPEATPHRTDLHLVAVPNPFNPQTTIEFALDKQQRAEVAVYDLTGRQIAVLVDRVYGSGKHSVVWNGKDAMGRAVPSGTYIVRLETEGATQAKKVMLIR